MSTAVAKRNGTAMVEPAEMPRSEALAQALTNGDISGLSPKERVDYYVMRCEAAGLDPRSQPFLYIKLPGRNGESGKLTLYATKACTDQLIARRHITVKIVRRGFDRDVSCYVAEAQATFPDGQIVEDVGAVFIGENLSGEPLANALMKCVTKAKRRTVLSACGLGMLDETEVETIPGAVRVNPEAVPTAIIERPPGPPMVHEATSEPRSERQSECKAFVKSAITAANDRLYALLAIEGKGEQFQPVVTHPNQVLNGLISTWALDDDGLEEKVSKINRNGEMVRDPAKVGAHIQTLWAQYPDEFRADVREYLDDKAKAFAESLGVRLVGDDDEAQATADEDPAE